MRLRVPGSILGALAIVAMAAGFLAVTATAASASGANHWYVATNGSNTNNACANSAHPCQTIGFALTQQAASHAGGTISVAAGTYTEQVSITPANDGVKLTGAGATTVIQPPSSGLLSDTDTDSGEPQYYVVDVAPGTTGVHLTGLSVSGLNGIPFLDADRQGLRPGLRGRLLPQRLGSD